MHHLDAKSRFIERSEIVITTGEKLRELRGSRSVREVSELMGIKRATLENYELDLRIPRDENKIKIAKFYKTTVQKLFYS